MATTEQLNPRTPETMALVALENAADLPCGKALTLHGENYGLSRDLLVLRREHAGDNFFLRLENPRDHYHARFCDDKAQLLEDLEYYFRSGALPIGKVNWF